MKADRTLTPGHQRSGVCRCVEQKASSVRQWFHCGERLNSFYLTIIGSVFVVWSTSVWWRFASNEDFTSLFIGAKVLRNGHPESLYAVDPLDFAVVDDPFWVEALIQENFSGDYWHPYVHLPLVARLLGFITDWTDFPTAGRWLVVLNSIAVVVIVWAVGKLFWKTLLKPPFFIAALLVLSSTTPLMKGMELGQTSPLIVASILLAFVLAVRRPWIAGFLLSVAVAVKLTPLLFVLIFLIRRRTRVAGFYAIAWGLLLGVLSVIATGVQLNKQWITVALQTGGQGLPVDMNQSPTGALLAGSLTSFEAIKFWPLEITPWITALLVVLGVGFVCASLAVVWWLPDSQRDALVAALTFVLPLGLLSVSWSHYYIVMIIPVALLGAYAEAMDSPVKRGWLALCGLVLVLLNSPVWVGQSVFPSFADPASYRGGAWSGLLAAIFLLIGAVVVVQCHREKRLVHLVGFGTYDNDTTPFSDSITGSFGEEVTGGRAILT